MSFKNQSLEWYIFDNNSNNYSVPITYLWIKPNSKIKKRIPYVSNFLKDYILSPVLRLCNVFFSPVNYIKL